jgi:eukaryotic-like serine/threonine-protein kinase
MTLTAGAKLGPYEIVVPLGAGGMGEVYRARDTRLGRDVAIKVLPEAFARDAERMARFRREAQVLASLNHPNIAAIYGFEDSGGTHALVMELVEGPTLAERIRSGAMAADEALPMAKQIAEALEYAHERGIVHRDLKPANIKISANDAVKILDFGLAKALEGDAASMDISSSPTITRMATQAGIVLGTAAYMSPEQAKGKSVDRRTDIWAFGCVLYEMLTGEMAFSGETVTDTLASIIKSEPDWALLSANTPARIRELLQRCLKKDARQRLQSIGDARIAIEELPSGAQTATESSTATAPQIHAAAVAHRKNRERIAWAAAAVFALATIALAAAYMQRSRVPKTHVVTLNMPLADIASPPLMALSHDGRYFAYLAQKGDHRVLAIRSMETGAVQYYSDLGRLDLAWSPDDRDLFFEMTGKFGTLDLDSGVVSSSSVLEESTLGAGWMPNRTILLGGVFKGILQIDPSRTGMQTLIRGENSEYFDPVMVDAGHFLFSTGNFSAGTFRVMLSTMNGKTVRELAIRSDTPAHYANGYVLFTSGGALMAKALQPDGSLGASVNIANHLASEPGRFRAFTVSQDGTIVYESGTVGAEELLLLDRTGKATELPLGGGSFNNPRFSPDGRFIAYDLLDNSGNRDVWIYNLALQQATRFSLGGINTDPIWSPDGKEIAYARVINGNFEIIARPANGATGERVLASGETPMFARDWSPDGRFLVYDQYTAGYAAVSIWKVAIAAGSTPSEYIPGDGFSKDTPRISPDGKWIIYESNESGEPQIYVESFPERTGKWEVSTGGGMQPRWSGDGRRIYFLSPENKLMAADVAFASSGPQVTKISEMFPVPPSMITGGNPLDVTRDGSRFVLNARRPDAGDTWHVLLNWTSLVKKQ